MTTRPNNALLGTGIVLFILGVTIALAGLAYLYLRESPQQYGMVAQVTNPPAATPSPGTTYNKGVWIPDRCTSYQEARPEGIYVRYCPDPSGRPFRVNIEPGEYDVDSLGGVIDAMSQIRPGIGRGEYGARLSQQKNPHTWDVIYKGFDYLHVVVFLVDGKPPDAFVLHGKKSPMRLSIPKKNGLALGYQNDVGFIGQTVGGRDYLFRKRQ